MLFMEERAQIFNEKSVNLIKISNKMDKLNFSIKNIKIWGKYS